MSNYRRSQQKGGTFFFTVALANRQRIKPRGQQVAHPTLALPPEDYNYSLRWQLIKRYFLRHFDVSKTRSHSKIKHREKGIWQRRFWEHEIRDEQDLQRCIDYVHFNPVKHDYVARCVDWEYSTFHRYVRLGMLPENWGGTVITHR